MSTIDSVAMRFAAFVPDVLAGQLIAFSIMKSFGVSRSLFDRVTSRDGEGVDFNTTIVDMTSVF